MARFNNVVEFGTDGHDRKTVIINGVDYGHLRFYRIAGELVAIKSHRIDFFPAELTSIMREEKVTLAKAEEKFRDINRHLMVTFENAASQEESIFLFGDTDVAGVAAVISAVHGKARVETNTRVLAVYLHGMRNTYRTLEDFYEEVPAEMLEATRF